MLTARLRPILASLGARIAGTLTRHHIRAWHLSLAPPLVSVFVVAPLLAYEQVILGIAIFMLAAPLDALDGSVARQQNSDNQRGHLIDLLSDRVTDMGFYFGGIFAAFSLWGSKAGAPLLGAALLGGLQSQLTVLAITSQLTIPLGWYQRTERLLLLGGGLFFSTALDSPAPLIVAASLSCAFSLIVARQRTLLILRSSE